MAKTAKNSSNGGDMAGRINRLLVGDIGRVVDVPVDLVKKTSDLVMNHNLTTISDFEVIDFVMPLALLIVIFVLQVLSFMTADMRGIAIVILLQVTLFRDLVKRVKRRPSGMKATGLAQPYEDSPGWGWVSGVYLASAPFLFGAGWLNLQIMRMLFPSTSLLHEFGTVFFGAAGETGMFALGVFFLGLLFFTVVVFAPVTEEIWFRGIGLAGFMRKDANPLRAMLWTSVVFGMLHGPSRFMFATLFGMLLSFIRFRTGSLYRCIVVHAVHNFLVFVVGMYMTSASP